MVTIEKPSSYTSEAMQLPPNQTASPSPSSSKHARSSNPSHRPNISMLSGRSRVRIPPASRLPDRSCRSNLSPLHPQIWSAKPGFLDNGMKPSLQTLVSNGHHREALFLYVRSHATSPQPNSFTFPFLLKACAKLESIPQTQHLHAHILKSGFQSDIYTATSLVSAYLKLQFSGDARKVFDEIPNPTLPSFNAIISGLSHSGQYEQSRYAFKRLISEGFRPNSVTLASALPACGTTKHGSQLHGFGVKSGHDSDRYVATALVTMYSNCAELSLASKAFMLIRNKTVVSYIAMVVGCLRNGSSLMALDFFRKMLAFSVGRLDSSSLLSILSVCSELSALLLGKEVHCYVLKCEVTSDLMVWTKLIDMYSKCEILEWGYRAFVRMENKNLVSWNSMISGLLSHGYLDRALGLLCRLRQEGFKPDSATLNSLISGFSQQGREVEALMFFTKMQVEGAMHPSLKFMTSLLQACSSISDIRHGKEIHCQVIKTGADSEDEFIQTALVHLYMKCGCSLHARRIFDGVEKQSNDPALWNAMITGYGRNGETDSALEIFREMQELGVKPNSATFLCAISACSHTGQVEKGWELLHTMNYRYRVHPTTEHFSAMVDLLSRAGKLEEAWHLIQRIPNPLPSAYSSLLGACGCHSDAALGQVTAEKLSVLEPRRTAPLVVLSNIYARHERWKDVEFLRKIMIDKELNKVPGCSWI